MAPHAGLVPATDVPVRVVPSPVGGVPSHATMATASPDLGVSVRPSYLTTVAVVVISIAFAIVVVVAVVGTARRVATLDERRAEALADARDPVFAAGPATAAFRRFRSTLGPGSRFALVYGPGVDRNGRSTYRLVAATTSIRRSRSPRPTVADAVMVFGSPPPPCARRSRRSRRSTGSGSDGARRERRAPARRAQRRLRGGRRGGARQRRVSRSARLGADARRARPPHGGLALAGTCSQPSRDGGIDVGIVATRRARARCRAPLPPGRGRSRASSRLAAAVAARHARPHRRGRLPVAPRRARGSASGCRRGCLGARLGRLGDLGRQGPRALRRRRRLGTCLRRAGVRDAPSGVPRPPAGARGALGRGRRPLRPEPDRRRGVGRSSSRSGWRAGDAPSRVAPARRSRRCGGAFRLGAADRERRRRTTRTPSSRRSSSLGLLCLLVWLLHGAYPGARSPPECSSPPAR